MHALLKRSAQVAKNTKYLTYFHPMYFAAKEISFGSDART